MGGFYGQRLPCLPTGADYKCTLAIKRYMCSALRFLSLIFFTLAGPVGCILRGTGLNPIKEHSVFFTVVWHLTYGIKFNIWYSSNNYWIVIPLKSFKKSIIAHIFLPTCNIFSHVIILISLSAGFLQHTYSVLVSKK